MVLRFPLPDVTVSKVSEVRKVTKPLFGDDYWQISQDEFAMKVDEVGSFYACKGREIDYSPLPGVKDESVQLYLNGSVFGVILYQRGILPMHGSCFAYEGRGVMLSGDSGTGKSALTASFAMKDCSFLTDDVTPVVFENDIPYILALSDRIKLWDDTLQQLNLDKSGLKRISPETDKYYFRIDQSNSEPVKLNFIYIMQIHSQKEVIIYEITGGERFSALHNEIYRREYLDGMPDNEKTYFGNLIDISNNVSLYMVKRPESVKVSDMMSLLRDHITNSIRGC